MPDFIEQLFNVDDFPARWHCGRWTDTHGWLHIVSDVAIFGAYVAIPCVLTYFVIKRQDVPFPRVFWLFGAFILFCGGTHLVEAIIFWQPIYRVSALLKLGTALVSWATVVALVPAVPRALAFRSPEALAAEVKQRTDELRESERTLKRLNDALREKNEEMEQFVYTVSHDLKAPLITSNGFLAALKEDLDNDDLEGVADAMRRIEGANSRMSRLIEDLLELSRVGRVRHRPEWIDTNATIAEVVAQLATHLSAAQARVEVAANLPPVYVDRIRFVQVLENLLTNAIKYGAPGSDRPLEVGVVEHACELRLYVRDYGPGVADSDKKRIFGLFERGNSKLAGTGVGLAIVARIAKIHGGESWVESRGAGATFWVSFARPAEALSA